VQLNSVHQSGYKVEFSLIDKSNYLKGLLIIARKDNQLAESEKSILKRISEKLGFASDFYEETIKNLLFNVHISDDPILFSNKKIAESFVSDGLKLAFSDNRVHAAEMDWLKATAEVNSLDDKWFEKELENVREDSNRPLRSDLTLYSIF
jgi:DnaJ-domain-containing protein 1